MKVLSLRLQPSIKAGVIRIGPVISFDESLIGLGFIKGSVHI